MAGEKFGCWCGYAELEAFSPHYLRCKRCATLVSQAPLDAIGLEEEDNSYYGETYWRETLPSRFPEESAEFYSLARRDFSERALFWLRALLGYKLPPASVLEAGCGRGTFLALLKWAGFAPTGLELSSWIVDFAAKTFDVPVLLGPVEKQNLPERSFDVIAMMDVFEHLADPLGSLRHYDRLLADGGFFLIQTPLYKEKSYEDILVEEEPSFRVHIDSNKIHFEHRYLFAEKGIRRFFDQLGYTHVSFLPPLYAYDCFFIASRQPMEPLPAAEAERALLQAGAGYLVQALLDMEKERDRRADIERQASLRSGQIEDLRRRLEARDRSLQEMTAGLPAIVALNNAIEASEKDLDALLARLDVKNRQLRQREEVIRHFRSSWGYWLRYGAAQDIPLLHKPYSAYRRVRQEFSHTIGVPAQYAPRELLIPRRYRPGRPATPDADASIAIVTPSFNQGEFIERTLLSVFAQEYPKLEYVVQDGGSTDNTPEVLTRYAGRLSGHASEKDGGQAHAVNLGFGRTSGEIMAFLNSDDILLPGALRTVANYFAAHPEVDVVYSHRINIDADGREIGLGIRPRHDARTLYWMDFIPQETMFWRRSIWEKAGGLDESFESALDWDLKIRFQEAGAAFVRLPAFLAAFRYHAAQKSSAQVHVAHEEMERILKRKFGRADWNERHRAIKPYLRRSIIARLLYRLGVRV